MSNDLISTREAAELLGCSVAAVTRLATTPAARPDLKTAMKAPGLRGARMFRRYDVERLKAKRERNAA